MPRFWLTALLVLPVLAILAAACGAAPQASPSADRVAQQVAEARAVAATLTALAPAPQTTGVAPAGATSAPPAATPAPSGAAATAAPAVLPSASTAPTSAPGCMVQTQGLRLRYGPGTVYEPAIAVLAAGTALEPLAFTPSGYPDGQWVQVRVSTTGQVGWVSAAPQLVTCTVNLAALPPGSIAPTPTAGVPPTATTAPTATNAPIAYRNVPVTGHNGDLKGQVVVPAPLARNTKPLTFHDRVVFQVEVRDPGSPDKRDGGGITSVEFTIDNENGDEAVHRIEKAAAFCPFGNSGPACDVWVFRDHGGKWPSGLPADPGRYSVQIHIEPSGANRQGADWNFDLVLE